MEYVIIGIIVIIVIWLIIVYNGLVTLRTRVREAWADIDVQLKRRYDLIPNLIETVKGYAKQERETFQEVTEARARAIGAGNIEEQAAAENMLTGALKSLFAVSENYPELKSNENFLELQRELADTENKIQSARRFYNGLVRDFNIKQDIFPNNLIAGMLRFEKSEFFELEEGSAEKDNVKVEF